ncbi:FUSC family protein [Pseudochelatococcus contaminans]|uniref:Putative membrane protein YccC n=1 Tax=Pseudochelatococcus contaminans TaxID=1538103 RepID=A0A7W6EFZ8_9HYPH|nr:FUSC family protein [Pseudochelatococcus contaminans]MBB3809179.1 putative membrane protein YccC [Pseudochelatococcus contaminans]
MPTRNALIGHAAFVLRCSLAAMASYELALMVGLHHPVWASVSAVIVSQASLNETQNAVLWRLAGTMTGIVVAVAVGTALAALSVDIAVQIGCGVALCAAGVRRWPDLKVAMWTVPIVYLSDNQHMPIAEAGFWRGVEVGLGGLVGAALHWLAEAVASRLHLPVGWRGRRHHHRHETVKEARHSDP